MPDQRYEPLPSLDQLPAFLWRRTSRRARLTLGVTLLAVIALTAALVPAIQRDRRERAAADQQAIATRHVRAVQVLRREQRPRFGQSKERERPAMLGALEHAILTDARARTPGGTVLRARCEPFPKTLGELPPERDPRKPSGSYACLAVTAVIDRTAASAGGELGDPYRAHLDFRSRRYAFCKVAGRPDPIPDPEVTTPRACS